MASPTFAESPVRFVSNGGKEEFGRCAASLETESLRRHSEFHCRRPGAAWHLGRPESRRGPGKTEACRVSHGSLKQRRKPQILENSYVVPFWLCHDLFAYYRSPQVGALRFAALWQGQRKRVSIGLELAADRSGRAAEPFQFQVLCLPGQARQFASRRTRPCSFLTSRRQADTGLEFGQ